MGVTEYYPEKIICEQLNSDNSVVFHGERDSWTAYLELSHDQRYEPEILAAVKPVTDNDGFEFIALNDHSRCDKLVRLLNEGFGLFINKLKEYPTTASIVAKEVFSNSANSEVSIQIRCSQHLPSEATREILLDDYLNIKAVSIVLNSDLFGDVIKAYKKMTKGSEDEQLGILWGLIKPLLHELGHSNLPRDRFFEEIHRVWCDCVAMRNIFFGDRRQKGYLVPYKAGKFYIKFFTERMLKKGI